MYGNWTAHNRHKLQILSLWHHILCSFDTCQLGKHFPFSEGQGSITGKEPVQNWLHVSKKNTQGSPTTGVRSRNDEVMNKTWWNNHNIAFIPFNHPLSNGWQQAFNGAEDQWFSTLGQDLSSRKWPQKSSRIDTCFETSLDISGDRSKPFLCLDPNIVRNEALFDDVT